MTLKCIAEQLGLSATTVSRVLSGQAQRYRISKKTETAVRRLATQANFSPNRVARGLRLRRTESIGLVIPDVSNPFFAGIAREITRGARQCGYSVIVCDSQESEEVEMESLDLLRGRGVEGIVLCPVGRLAEHLVRFEEEELPIVLADRYFPGLRLPYVASDNFGGAREATTHLLENGHRRIACVQGLAGSSPNEDRLRGYWEALEAHRIAVDESLIVGDGFGEQNGYIATKLLLRTAHDVTALLAFSNLIALGAIRALSEEELQIPGDVSLVSFDDQPYCAYLAAPLTAVAQSSAEMGQIAVKLLFDRIRSPQRVGGGGILLPTNLVTRGSVRKLNELGAERKQRHVCG
jgi:LacI family transcriptional regulator